MVHNLWQPNYHLPIVFRVAMMIVLIDKWITFGEFCVVAEQNTSFRRYLNEFIHSFYLNSKLTTTMKTTLKWNLWRILRNLMIMTVWWHITVYSSRSNRTKRKIKTWATSGMVCSSPAHNCGWMVSRVYRGAIAPSLLLSYSASVPKKSMEKFIHRHSMTKEQYDVKYH